MIVFVWMQHQPVLEPEAVTDVKQEDEPQEASASPEKPTRQSRKKPKLVSLLIDIALASNAFTRNLFMPLQTMPHKGIVSVALVEWI